MWPRLFSRLGGLAVRQATRSSQPFAGFHPRLFSSLSIAENMRSVCAFSRLLEEIAEDSGLQLTHCDSRYTHTLVNAMGKKIVVYGRIMGGLNSQISHLLCRDKAASTIEFEASGIPHIPHQLAQESEKQLLQQYAENFSNNIVLKPNIGNGGRDVFHCIGWEEIEAQAKRLFQIHRAVSISPYILIRDEYRIVVLENNVEMIYRKQRPQLVGDGKSSLSDLFSNTAEINQKNAPRFDDWGYIPEEGELVTASWKHNKQAGSTPRFDVDEKDQMALRSLALTACKTMGIHFAACDIAVDENGERRVLEINPSVYMPLSPDHRILTRQVYEKALLKAFLKAEENSTSIISPTISLR